MVKTQENFHCTRSPSYLGDSFFDTPPHNKKMGNFVLDKNGQININRKGMENNYGGFRLQELNHNTEICSNKDMCDDTTTSVSGYSNYKQRIDSMFDDSRSQVSDRSKSLNKPPNKKDSKSHLDNRMKLLEDYEESSDRSISNNIQEKIEKMFEEISIHGFERSNSFRNLKTRKKQEAMQNQNTLSHDFKVIYLGSKPLADKSVSLISLQDPLRDLYFEFQRKRISNQSDILAISREGLKFKIKDKEHLNPFPTIAVWASVKLSFRNVSGGTEYAFLPLITDPDGIDKNTLFRHLRSEDKNTILGNFHGKIDEDNHLPIFTVVMKNNQLNKQLECHGFLCNSSEEAIVIAANLYQALMKKLKRKNKAREEKKNYENYSKSEGTTTETEEEKKPPPKKIPPPVPSRPPRKVKKDTEKEDLILELEETFQEVRKQEKSENKISRRGSVPTNIYSVEHEPVRTLRRSVSERRSNGFTVNDQTEGGDILTKVAIPRSRSFLNANGPLTRYSRRYKSKAHNEIISPLGLKELFNEFRLNEGLESTDDILNAIIDAEGMSFNDLKPIYKEFLLKLAVTLTKDELYQRSKIIMRRQKKKSRKTNLRKRPFISTTGISKVFKKTASKLGKQKSSRPTNLEFTSIVFQSSNKHFETSTSSTSSCGFKLKSNIKRRPSSKRRVTKKPERAKNKKLSTTSDDSDFFMMRNTTESGGGPNRSSSGYFSCSECSYDSENCTCTSADKCYCTLGQNKKIEQINSSTVEPNFSDKDKSGGSLDTPNPDVLYDTKDKESVKSCCCDTESCAASEKCYCNEEKEPEPKILHLSDVKGICQTPHLHQTDHSHNLNCPNYGKNNCKKHGQTIFEQLKQQGFAASDSSLSRAASPSTAWRTNEEKLRKPKECLKTSRSLEFLQIRRPETRQQIHECPPPPMQKHIPRNPSLENILLKEIQNTEMRLPQQNFVEGTRHFCYHGPDLNRSFRRRDAYSGRFHNGPRRQYSSMRSRNEFSIDFSDHGTFYRGNSYRTKNRLFSSVRSKHSCDNIMNHVLFPHANSRNSSLRFTRRMDVYNSFSKRSSLGTGSYIDLLNRIETGYIESPNAIVHHNDLIIPRHVCQHESSPPPPPPPPQIYQSSRGSDNFHKLDYDLFTSAKSETSETISNNSERKVLVVSARDPKGKVLYMGASTRGEKISAISKEDNGNGNANEALSFKKSAEIAALFSDVNTKPKTHRSGHVREERHHHKRSNSYRCTNMENTLGYLP